jgi:hypothetical protein
MYADAFEMEIVADWTDNGPVENELYRMIGREWEFRRKHQKPSNGAPPGSHTFVDYPGPPPTAEDIREVRNEVQGQTWRFERTIYSNEHYTDTQRIIHLFVRVDEYGQVQEVSMTCTPYRMNSLQSLTANGGQEPGGALTT